jgi:streptogramin lyase
MKKTPLLVGLLLISCQTNLPHVQSPAPTRPSAALSTQSALPSSPSKHRVVTPEGLESVAGRVRSQGTGDAVALNVVVKRPPAFRAQAFDLTRIKFLKGLVRAIDLANPLENQEGFVNVDVNQKSLRIEGVPKGQNRIVTVQAYEGTAGNETLIPDIVLKAIYSSSTDPNMHEVDVRFSLQSTLAANVLETLIDQPLADGETQEDREELINSIDPGELQTLINQITEGPQTPNVNPFTGTPVSPGAIDPQAIVDAIVAQAESTPTTPIPSLPPDDSALSQWTYPENPVQVTAQSPAETPYSTHTIVVQITDPYSPPQTVEPGSGVNLDFENIPPGTWEIISTVQDENGQPVAQEKLKVTIPDNGDPPTFTDMNDNPVPGPTFTFNPILTAVTNEEGNSQPIYNPGTTVIIQGDGFDTTNPGTTNTITINGVEVELDPDFPVSSTSLPVILPPDLEGEDLVVVVTTNGKPSSSITIDVLPPPDITLSTPVNAGEQAATLVLTGEDFDPDSTTVTIGTYTVPPENMTINGDGTSITITNPPIIHQTTPITVTTPAGTDTYNWVPNVLYGSVINYFGQTQYWNSTTSGRIDLTPSQLPIATRILNPSPAPFDTYYDPHGLNIDGCKNMYIADNYASRIYKHNPDGTIAWVLGPSNGGTGLTNGTYSTGSETTFRQSIRFSGPEDVANGPDGKLYVADTGNNAIRVIAPNGLSVTTLNTGGLPVPGPEGIEVSQDGNYLYVTSNTAPNTSAYVPTNKVQVLRVYIGPDASAPALRVEVVAGGLQRDPNAILGTPTNPNDGAFKDGSNNFINAFHHLEGLGMDGAGNIYVAEADLKTIRKVNPTTQTFTTIATFADTFQIHEIRVDPDGNVIVPGERSGKIFRIDPHGAVSTVANSAGLYGLQPGPAVTASFALPIGADFDPQGNLFIADRNWGIRQITRFYPMPDPPPPAYCGAG